MLRSFVWYISTCLVVLVLLVGCKKAQVEPYDTYHDGWGMNGVIDGDSFKATSLYATAVLDSMGFYTVDISGWHNQPNKVIYLHLAKASLSATTTYTLTPVDIPDKTKNYAYYQHSYKDYAHAGYVYISRYDEDSVIRGTYYFETTIGVKVKGAFFIKPNS